MTYLGIDPGLSGAVALLLTDSNDVATTEAYVLDVPTTSVTKNGKNRTEYVIPTMAAMLRQMGPIDHAVLEKVGAMPGQGVTSMFSFGRGLGLWEGILATLEIPYTLVPPQTWKKQLLGGMDKSSKDSSRQRAIQLFPKLADQLKRKKDDGRAEALLLSEYARRFS